MAESNHIMNYYIWTMGCQMNKAESSDIAEHLDSLSMQPVKQAREADLAVLNTCVVRQNAEDKVTGMLGYLKGLKAENPSLRIAVTGCFVTSDMEDMNKRYPHVDHFFLPGELEDFKGWIYQVYKKSEARAGYCSRSGVNAYLPIIQGCNNFCTYCIVPYRRGRERSRKPAEILEQASRLLDNGAREITLVGQNVNTYGKDLPEKSSLAELLHELEKIDGLKRIRFLTNHPKDMGHDLIQAIAVLPKVCHHACLPLQAGDNVILNAMNRHYTLEDYRSLVGRIRSAVPDMALSTDIIVGFPGETEQQYRNTFNAIRDIRFDAVHVAAYSTRSGTSASRDLQDDVESEVKLRRLHEIENLEKEILTGINTALIGKEVEVLVEGRKGGKWYGRTGSDKLVFFEDQQGQTGQLVRVRVTSATAWSLQGELDKVI